MMPDWSEMKHVTLFQKHNYNYEEGDLLASIEGNNFGDAIIYYRVYEDKEGMMGFSTIGKVMYHEGQHPSHLTMIEESKWLLRDYKKKVKHV